MRTTNFRRGLVIGVGTLLSGALLTLPTTGTAFAGDGSNHPQQCKECHERELEGEAWLDYYLWETEESDGSLYPESDNGVMAGPDGQGDYRNGFPVPF